jgi:Mg2+-importing ATPase
MIRVAAAAAIGVILPFTSLRHVLGFTSLPGTFFIVLAVLILACIVLVDLAKIPFYRIHDARSAAPDP